MTPDKIQLVKVLKPLKYKNINLGSAMAARLYQLDVMNYIKLIFLSLLFKPYINSNIKCNENKLVFFYNKNNKKRADYREIIDFISDTVECVHVPIQRKIDLNFLRKIRLVLYFYWSLLGSDYKLNERVVICFLASYFAVLVTDAQKFDYDNWRKVVTFCDSYLEENVLAQLAKFHGIETYTLQHGLYKYTGEILTTDSEAYLNFVSDYMMVWGKSTADELHKSQISPSRIKICGVPRYFDYSSVLNFKGHVKSLCVYFDGTGHSKTNLKMYEVCLEFCNDHNIDLYVKHHPTHQQILPFTKSVSTYKGECVTVDQDIDWHVVCSSGVAAELILCGHKVVFYDSGSTKNHLAPTGLTFSSNYQLDSIMANKPFEDLKSVRSYICLGQSIEDVKNNYKRGFCS